MRSASVGHDAALTMALPLWHEGVLPCNPAWMAGVAGGLQGPWYRIQAILSPARSSSAEWDFVTVLPAVLSAAQSRRPFVVGWVSRGGGAPLELLTNAGSADGSLLFPNGARGRPIGETWMHEAGRMVWTRCPG